MTDKDLRAFADLICRLQSDDLDSVATIIFQELRLRAGRRLMECP